MDYKNLYLKYKFKYVNLKEQIGGRISNVGTALFFKDTIYLVKENNGKWNLPGGKIDAGETDYQASIREFYEETGGFHLDIWTSELHEPLRNKVINELLYGQSHKHTKIFLYYLDKAYSDKPDINFNINRETTDGQWFNIYDLPNIRFQESMTAVISQYINDKELVGTALFFKDTIYLVKENNGKWNLPSGRIEAGETDYQASIRKFYEETGGFRLDIWTSELHEPLRDLVINKLLYGQSQHTKIFLYYLDKAYGDKPDINFNINDETTDGQWFNIYDLPNIRFQESMTAIISQYINDKELEK
jgi:8-oxo-dGTP pyrophosphatase MutT (NUDIX family)